MRITPIGENHYRQNKMVMGENTPQPTKTQSPPTQSNPMHNVSFGARIYPLPSEVVKTIRKMKFQPAQNPAPSLEKSANSDGYAKLVKVVLHAAEYAKPYYYAKACLSTCPSGSSLPLTRWIAEEPKLLPAILDTFAKMSDPTQKAIFLLARNDAGVTPLEAATKLMLAQSKGEVYPPGISGEAIFDKILTFITPENHFEKVDSDTVAGQLFTKNLKLLMGNLALPTARLLDKALTLPLEIRKAIFATSSYGIHYGATSAPIRSAIHSGCSKDVVNGFIKLGKSLKNDGVALEEFRHAINIDMIDLPVAKDLLEHSYKTNPTEITKWNLPMRIICSHDFFDEFVKKVALNDKIQLCDKIRFTEQSERYKDITKALKDANIEEVK